MKLYEIAEQYQLALRDLYDPETGEINENALALVNEIKDPMERKCINLVKFFKGLEAEAEAINAEKQRLAKRESSFNKQVDSLKDYLLMNMKNAQLQEVKSPEFVIKFKEDKASVDIYDENAVSDMESPCLAVSGSPLWPGLQSPQQAGVAQLVEHWLPKPRVAGSSPVSRFVVAEPKTPRLPGVFYALDDVPRQVVDG